MKALRTFAILFLLSLFLPGLSQTIDLEHEALMKRYLKKEFTQLEFKEISFSWRDLMDSIGYPELPFDPQTKKVEYEFRSIVPGITRETIVNRVSEWAAVTFGSINSILTHQKSNNSRLTSRIIFNGSVELYFPDLYNVWGGSWKGYVKKERENSGYCFFTMVVTIKDGKLKSQILNIAYEYTNHLTQKTVNRTLNSCFPVSNYKQEEWKPIISLVNETNDSYSKLIASMVSYIKDYENDYSW